MKKDEKKVMNRRMIYIAAVGIIIVAVFFLRLLQLQIFSGDEYRNAAYAQKWQSIDIKAKRGQIIDKNGNVLAESSQANDLYIYPELIREEDRDGVKKDLIKNFSIDEKKFEGLWDKKGQVLLKKGLNQDEVKKLDELKPPGTRSQADISRSYPEGETMAHVLGHLNSDYQGISGIEKSMDQYLSGQDGLELMATDPSGRILSAEEGRVYPAKEGNSVRLTLDLKLNAQVENIINKAKDEFSPKSISIIVSKPQDGSILAMQNYPSYDPNNPNLKDGKELDEEEAFKSWRNIAVSDSYEPGSVYKLITASTALNEKTSDLNSKYYCNGYIRDIPGVVIRCHRFYEPHGEESFSEALQNSCNPAFVQIARQAGLENMYKYREDFGFGRKTGIDLPAESPGIVKEGLENIGPAELATMSYGHGFTATPIQMITACNATVNGGRIYRPRIVDSIEDREGNKLKEYPAKMLRQVISEETSKTMRELEKSTVDKGVSNAVKMDSMGVCGKSGTSIKVVDGRYKSDVTVASFYAAFPSQNPEYSVMVVIDEPKGVISGNGTAGKIAKDVIYSILEVEDSDSLKGIREKEANREIEVPDLNGLSLKEGTKKLDDLGLSYEFSREARSPDQVIEKQVPDPGQKIKRGQPVKLDISKEDVDPLEMPDLTGLDIDEARKKLEEMGLKVEVRGQGRVKSQSPEKSSMADPSSPVLLEGEEGEERAEENMEKKDSPSGEDEG